MREPTTLEETSQIFRPTDRVESTGAEERYGWQSPFCIVGNSTGQLPSGIKGTGPSSGPPDSIKSSSCSSAWGEAEASLLGDALLVGDAEALPSSVSSWLGDGDAVALDGLLVVVGDALLVVVGDALLVVPP